MKTRRVNRTDLAWFILWAYVAACNLLLEEKLSEAVDRYLKSRYRWPVEAWLIIFYLHLANRIPTRIDPLAHLGDLPARLNARRAATTTTTRHPPTHTSNTYTRPLRETATKTPALG